MMQLADEFFHTKSDPDQISVTEEIITTLRTLHPATLTEERNEDGPIAWMLVIPTTHKIMEEFIAGKLSERELLERTTPGRQFDAIYLCSALVLPEHRRKGIATRLLTNAVQEIRSDHPIRSLFYWAFSTEGERLAVAVSKHVGLPLYRRTV
jgi:GNAT superfamily N-acetyltransferase